MLLAGVTTPAVRPQATIADCRIICRALRHEVAMLGMARNETPDRARENNDSIRTLPTAYRRFTWGESEMRNSALLKSALLAAGIVAAVGFGARPSQAGYIQTNLVSDIAGLAMLKDPSLRNPWGISFGPGTPFWVSDQAANVTTLYAVQNGSVSKANEFSFPVGAPPQGPTGQVSNIGGGNFAVIQAGKNLGPARFIFADLDGSIYAWNSLLGATTSSQVSTPGAVYTGLAISSGKDKLYAANTKAGRIDVFDGSFAAKSLGAGAFQNPFPGLVPFNVQQIGGKIYVTYAVPGRPAMQAAGEGSGAVAVFDENGVLEKALIDGSKLASPWGLALAPAGFGQFSGDLLVGNFSFVASEINAFDPVTGAYEGTIPVNPGPGNTPGGLWGLTFGGGGKDGDPHVLYFADGINFETNGLFASIAVPEPSSLVLLIAALGLVSAGYGIAQRRA